METNSSQKEARDQFSISVLLRFGMSASNIASIPDGALRPIVAAIALPFNNMLEARDQVSVRKAREHVMTTLITAAGLMKSDSMPMDFAEQLREDEVVNITAGIILERVCKMIEAYQMLADGTAFVMPAPR